MRATFAALLLAFLALPAMAVDPSEMLADPALEARARDISADLRCLVCQNQSIDDSDAQLAKDLRLLVRERLVQGETNEQVKSYVVSRYGEFVLLRPPFNSSTYVLWYGPPVFVICGILALIVVFRRKRMKPNQPADLSAEERQRLEALLDDEDKP